MDFVYDDMRGTGMKLLPFSDGTYEWNACMITRREEYANEAVQIFLRHIEDWLEKIRIGEIIR